MVWLFFLLGRLGLSQACIQTLSQPLQLRCRAYVDVVRCAALVQRITRNIQAFSLHGGLNDPGPASRVAHTLTICRWSSACSRMIPLYNPPAILSLPY